jgi:hypothetical protein
MRAFSSRWSMQTCSSSVDKSAPVVLQLLWRYNKEAVALRIAFFTSARPGGVAHTVLVRDIPGLDFGTLPARLEDTALRFLPRFIKRRLVVGPPSIGFRASQKVAENGWLVSDHITIRVLTWMFLCTSPASAEQTTKDWMQGLQLSAERQEYHCIYPSIQLLGCLHTSKKAP